MWHIISSYSKMLAWIHDVNSCGILSWVVFISSTSHWQHVSLVYKDSLIQISAVVLVFIQLLWFKIACIEEECIGICHLKRYGFSILTLFFPSKLCHMNHWLFFMYIVYLIIYWDPLTITQPWLTVFHLHLQYCSTHDLDRVLMIIISPSRILRFRNHRN